MTYSRCTCKKNLMTRQTEFEERAKLVKTDADIGKILDDLKLKRICCRRMMITYVKLEGIMH